MRGSLNVLATTPNTTDIKTLINPNNSRISTAMIMMLIADCCRQILRQVDSSAFWYLAYPYKSVKTVLTVGELSPERYDVPAEPKSHAGTFAFGGLSC